MTTTVLIQPVILSGGSGTRLWPLSREKYPKQLLPLMGADSLLQATVRRVEGIADAQLAPPMVVCNEEYRFVIAEQLRLLGKPGTILLEPCGRNTAPALTLSALAAIKNGADPVLLVMPADHVITDIAAFQRVVSAGAQLAAGGAVVTFGITPDTPETGYGYIQCGAAYAGAPDSGACLMARFVEKPDLSTAQAYLAAGSYLWNSGLFMLRASVWLDAMKSCRPDILAACQSAWGQGSIDGDFVRVGKEGFTQCPSDSIDYAVMERIAARTCDSGATLPTGVVIPMSAGWSDVGAWDALWQVLPKDACGNVSQGDVLLQDCENTLALSEGRLIACVGVSDLVVVETADAILVAHKDKTQDVKKIVDRLKAQGRAEGTIHRKVFRPWGWYDGVDAGERFQVKRIVVKPGGTLSLQMHHHRAEHWIVVSGTARVTCGDKAFLLSENQSTFIPLGTTHRLENPGRVALEMIEVQSGSYLGEDDIVRFEDVYGR
ncbi:MAG: mannose-1-phosphate guanylyltransferase/mannose-6-phosphate isomerase [Gammaproteobacteria bacterium]|uniref:mannose-1-phosphate guanylyltransferase/mannose-6-phosphate isomerase n=1 Tax=Rhodoferax sp. TaxID=50421 RepID=UPI0017EF7EC9|nr:mannose-1-phosphate guanylyltransferase/mannose-6-phosphate isomerase [Rhodoferax sp.]MBU3897528.1 mannose-1-phosphate guanylyltransferase/mannose-6-phosphate isomerase [Gammaproteobacteria bacterium]MBA3058035.1 mannose-1-phosphate guanylyltransferase/mannose-6-phosphate isomerase [Rhodoferax sp.]MBU3999357.1 mannose-1-phosphate guanylyltransferase/mannose-6-phosphate isomerase [Gammaproteobacteria bacterium]MBU4018875.1 mannose-1-phosphate guanylyltransferase/mannose-6-phosphate isomerase 